MFEMTKAGERQPQVKLGSNPDRRRAGRRVPRRGALALPGRFGAPQRVGVKAPARRCESKSRIVLPLRPPRRRSIDAEPEGNQDGTKTSTAPLFRRTRSNGNARYMYFAKQADVEGPPRISTASSAYIRRISRLARDGPRATAPSSLKPGAKGRTPPRRAASATTRRTEPRRPRRRGKPTSNHAGCFIPGRRARPRRTASARSRVGSRTLARRKVARGPLRQGAAAGHRTEVMTKLRSPDPSDCVPPATRPPQTAMAYGQNPPPQISWATRLTRTPEVTQRTSRPSDNAVPALCFKPSALPRRPLKADSTRSIRKNPRRGRGGQGTSKGGSGRGSTRGRRRPSKTYEGGTTRGPAPYRSCRGKTKERVLAAVLRGASSAIQVPVRPHTSSRSTFHPSHGSARAKGVPTAKAERRGPSGSASWGGAPGPPGRRVMRDRGTLANAADHNRLIAC